MNHHNKNDYVLILSCQCKRIQNSVINDYFKVIIGPFNNIEDFKNTISKCKLVFLFEKSIKINNEALSFIFTNKNKYNYKIFIGPPLEHMYTTYGGISQNLLKFTKKELEICDAIFPYSPSFTSKVFPQYENKMYWFPFVYTPFSIEYNRTGLNDNYVTVNTEKKYVIAIGQKQRDYSCLINAIKDIDINLIICTNNKISCNYDNVQIVYVKNKLQFRKLIENSLFCILPVLKSKPELAMNTINEYLILKKCVLITKNVGIDEYIMNDTFGISYEISNVDDLKEKIKFLLKDNKYLDYEKNYANYPNFPDSINPMNFVKKIIKIYKKIK
jgi:glycosyltransferase involved in cell wall biosynthesis